MIVSKGKLKAKMLEYFREVERTGEPLIVTDHGREVLEVRPIRKTSSVEELLAEYRAGEGKGIDGVPEEVMIEPIPETEWEALREGDSDSW